MDIAESDQFVFADVVLRIVEGALWALAKSHFSWKS